MTAQIRIVPVRQQQFGIEELGLRCDAREIPDFWQLRKADSYWLAAHALLDSPQSGLHAKMVGACAIAVHGTQIAMIISPGDTAQPAAWLTFDRKSEVQVTTSGETGLLRKRPVNFALAMPTATIELREVAQLFRSSGSMKTGQEAAFYKLFS